MSCLCGDTPAGDIIEMGDINRNQPGQQNPPARQNKLLHDACLHGNETRILELLQVHGELVNEVNAVWGETPQSIAHGNRFLELLQVHGLVNAMNGALRNRILELLQVYGLVTEMNGWGETPLFIALGNRCTGVDVIHQLMEGMTVEAIQTVTSDTHGDSPRQNVLHRAARHSTLDVVRTVLDNLREKYIGPEKIAALIRAGDLSEPDNCTPLHLATENEDPYVFLEILKNSAERERYTDTPKLLPVFARNIFRHDMGGDNRAMELLSTTLQTLMAKGYSLDDTDAEGNNMFHILTQLSVDETPAIRKNRDIILGWFRKSLCRASSLTLNRKKRGFREACRQSPRHYARNLLTKANNEKLDVFHLACKVGAADILTCIFSIPGLMVAETTTHHFYDVTDMIPATKRIGGCFSCREPAYLERLLYERNQEATCKVLNCQLFRIIERRWYWFLWFVNLLHVVSHVIIMSLISFLGIPMLERHCDEGTSLMSLLVIQLVESIVILIGFCGTAFYPVFFIANSLKETCCGRTSFWYSCRFSSHPPAQKREMKAVTYLTLDLLFLFLFVATYCGSVVAVVTFVATGECIQASDTSMILPFSLTLFSGWMYTIYLCSGFEKFHRVWYMIVHIFFRDILFFSFVFAFLFLATVCAVHPIFMLSEELSRKYPTVWDGMFLMFHLTTGLWDAFDGSLPDAIGELEENAQVFLKLGSVVFTVLSVILLLNLLIAMMNDTVVYLKQQDPRTVFRFARFQQALWGLPTTLIRHCACFMEKEKLGNIFPEPQPKYAMKVSKMGVTYSLVQNLDYVEEKWTLTM